MEKQSEKGAKDQRYCGEKNTDIGKEMRIVERKFGVVGGRCENGRKKDRMCEMWRFHSLWLLLFWMMLKRVSSKTLVFSMVIGALLGANQTILGVLVVFRGLRYFVGFNGVLVWFAEVHRWFRVLFISKFVASFINLLLAYHHER